MTSVDRILGESHTEAMMAYARVFYGRGHLAPKERCPWHEASMAKDPQVAYLYAKNVLKDRFLDGEAAIASSKFYTKVYLEAFPEAADDWAMNGWIDWLDT